MYYTILGIQLTGAAGLVKILKFQEVSMKYLSLAVCSLGIMYLLGAFISGSWVQIVFGAIAAVFALAGAAKSK